MAGGRSNNKRSGNLDRTHQWLCCHQLYASVVPEPPSSEIFKKYQRVERNRVVAKSLNNLQDDILRIFTDSLYCDLNIIHGYDIIRANQCIVRTRAPHFYKALEPHFVYANSRIDCVLDKLEIFRRIEGFVRYSHVANRSPRSSIYGSYLPHEYSGPYLHGLLFDSGTFARTRAVRRFVNRHSDWL